MNRVITSKPTPEGFIAIEEIDDGAYYEIYICGVSCDTAEEFKELADAYTRFDILTGDAQ